MSERILVLYADDVREVFLSELADVPSNELQYDLGDDHGYFICEASAQSPQCGYEILGKVSSYEAAIRLRDMFMMHRPASHTAHAAQV